jgi:hypothetical protein
MYVIIYHSLLNVVAFYLRSKNTKWNICYIWKDCKWLEIMKGRNPRAAHFICRWWQLDLHFISFTYMFITLREWEGREWKKGKVKNTCPGYTTQRSLVYVKMCAFVNVLSFFSILCCRLLLSPPPCGVYVHITQFSELKNKKEKN